MSSWQSTALPARAISARRRSWRLSWRAGCDQLGTRGRTLTRSKAFERTIGSLSADSPSFLAPYLTASKRACQPPPLQHADEVPLPRAIAATTFTCVSFISLRLEFWTLLGWALGPGVYCLHLPQTGRPPTQRPNFSCPGRPQAPNLRM